MIKKLAFQISNYLEKSCDNPSLAFTLKRIDDGEPIEGFHQWVDHKDLLGAFLVTSFNEQSFYILLIDWQEKDNFYLVIYPDNKSGPIAELHKTEQNHGFTDLYWSYQPAKRDGRNAERKAYFEKYFLTTDVRIKVPDVISDVQSFLNEIFALANNRLKADELASNPPDYRCGFPEGRTYERIHMQRERNQKVVELAKKQAIDEEGKLVCDVCGFDFHKIYGDIGYGFIEAHHTIPVSELNEDNLTKVEDIALVCSNCHSMLHKKRPWLRIKEMKKILSKN